MLKINEKDKTKNTLCPDIKIISRLFWITCVFKPHLAILRVFIKNPLYYCRLSKQTINEKYIIKYLHIFEERPKSISH